MISYLQGLILGLLQGATELFPVSSLGHSVILPRLLGWDIHQNDDDFVTFLVATHFATAATVFVYFWDDWKRILAGLWRSVRSGHIAFDDTYARLGWFLVVVLKDFAPICERRQRSDLAQRYANEERWLTWMLELSWDGDWYRRAYFDDGTPLGSVQNEECKIDSLTQSWAVLSQAAHPERAERAMEAVRAHLVRRDAGLVLLLTPPFDRAAHEPDRPGRPRGLRVSRARSGGPGAPRRRCRPAPRGGPA